MTNKEKLEKEKEKLNRLVEEALNNGNALAQSDIVSLSCKVDMLVVKAQKEMKKHIKKQQDR